jgi:hypothetical protein
MKLICESGNVGLDNFISGCEGINLDYDQEEVLEYLVFMDNLDIEIAEDMINCLCECE